MKVITVLVYIQLMFLWLSSLPSVLEISLFNESLDYAAQIAKDIQKIDNLTKKNTIPVDISII